MGPLWQSIVQAHRYDLESVAVLQGAAYRAIGGENLSPWSKRVTARVDSIRFQQVSTAPFLDVDFIKQEVARARREP